MRGLWFPEKSNTVVQNRFDLIFLLKIMLWEDSARWLEHHRKNCLNAEVHATRKYNWLVPGTSYFFFLFGAYPFFARTLLQGKSQCKALSGINEKNKQATTTTTATKRWQGKAGRESSLEPILLGEWIATPVLYCIFGCSLSHLRSLLWNFF